MSVASARDEQLGQLAGADPAQQIHLEKPVLCVDETGGIGKVEPVAALQQRNAVLVARHADGSTQAGCAACAVELGQAGAQEQPGAKRRQRQHANASQQDAQ